MLPRSIKPVGLWKMNMDKANEKLSPEGGNSKNKNKVLKQYGS